MAVLMERLKHLHRERVRVTTELSVLRADTMRAGVPEDIRRAEDQLRSIQYDIKNLREAVERGEQ